MFAENLIPMKTPIILTLLFLAGMLQAQDTVRLYSIVPNSKPAPNGEKSTTRFGGIAWAEGVSVPEMLVFQPPKSNGTAVVVCPGGAYSGLAIDHEGQDVAKTLNEWGVTAFVLKYRLPSDETMEDKSIGPLQDAERAMQIVREHANLWNIDPQKVGVMGFSAGGHLAASLSTRYREQLIDNPKRTSFRPDFSVLVYPVISFTDSLTHMGSRNRLIGKKPSADRIKRHSNELNVDEKTPPAFLVHARDDMAVPIGNTMAYYGALRDQGIPSAVRIFEKGGHGFGMHNQMETGDWMADLRNWLMAQQFLPATD